MRKRGDRVHRDVRHERSRQSVQCAETVRKGAGQNDELGIQKMTTPAVLLLPRELSATTRADVSLAPSQLPPERKVTKQPPAIRGESNRTMATRAPVLQKCGARVSFQKSNAVSGSCKEIGSYSKGIQVLAKCADFVVKASRHMKRIIQLSVLTFGAMFIFSGCGGGDEGGDGGGDGNSSQNDSAPVTEQSA